MASQVNHLRHLNYVNEIAPLSKGWTVKVMVCEKKFARTIGNTRRLEQNFMLSDSQGNNVEIVLSEDQIDRFEGMLKVGSYCYISNAVVKLVSLEDEYRNRQSLWVIDDGTSIEKCDNVSEKAFSKLELTAFGSLSKVLDAECPINVIGVVVDIIPKKDLKLTLGSASIQDIILIDQCCVPIQLVLRDSYVNVEGAMLQERDINLEKPTILLATRVTVTSHKGFSLALETDTYLMLNPELEETKDLVIWARLNKSSISSAVGNLRSQSYIARKPLLDNSIAMPICELRETASHSSYPWFWVYANVSIWDESQAFYYMACNLCNTKIDTETSGSCFCDSCNAAQDVVPRVKVVVKLFDDSDVINAIVEGDEAEKLFEFRATDLWKNKTQVGKTFFHRLTTEVTTVRLLIQLEFLDPEFRVTYVDYSNISSESGHFLHEETCSESSSQYGNRGWSKTSDHDAVTSYKKNAMGVNVIDLASP